MVTNIYAYIYTNQETKAPKVLGKSLFSLFKPSIILSAIGFGNPCKLVSGCDVLHIRDVTCLVDIVTKEATSKWIDGRFEQEGETGRVLRIPAAEAKIKYINI